MAIREIVVTKQLIVDPSVEREQGVIQIPAIPLNQYSTPIAAEAERFGAQSLVGILEDMILIREFEEMLSEIKTLGSYRGVLANYGGPAHLCIGQEALAVGLAFHLDCDDHVYGSHRSHGEVLAKGASAIRKLGPDHLMETMEGYLAGECLSVVSQHEHGSVSELARDFLVYGILAEIFGKRTGFNRGLGGSMHVFFPPFGIFPNNAIVGGSAPMATGAALFKRVQRAKGLVIANIGDASISSGPVLEAMGFSSMGQFRTLWDEAHRGGLPIIFNFVNNFYGMGGQPAGETTGLDVLARAGAGVGPEAMHAERVDGNNPLAVMDAVDRKRRVLEKGEGPVLLDTITYRYSGHSPSDAGAYRTDEEVELWKAEDPVEAFARKLRRLSIIDEAGVEELKQTTRKDLTRVVRWATDEAASPTIAPEDIGALMFSNAKPDLGNGAADVLIPKSENPRLLSIDSKVRGVPEGPEAVPKSRVYQFRDAVFEAVLHHCYEDPTMVVYGQENREWGGAFGCYRGLDQSLPYHRLFNAPISEATIVGSAVGYACEGGRALVELMYCDFIGRAGDEVLNQLPKWQAMSAGVLQMPVVVRISVGSKYGAQHSQDWGALLAHVPGLKIVYPVTPYDVKGLLHSALSGSDPVIVLESQRLYDIGEMFEADVPAGYFEVPIGLPAVRRTGDDLTLVTIGPSLYTALEAADQLEARYGLTCEVIDCRSVNPIDYSPIVASVEKTGRVVLVSEACERGSVLHTVASHLSQLVFDYLDAPPVVVGSRNWITPSVDMEHTFFPQASWIIDAIHERIRPLAGHEPTTNQSVGALRQRTHDGV